MCQGMFPWAPRLYFLAKGKVQSVYLKIWNLRWSLHDQWLVGLVRPHLPYCQLWLNLLFCLFTIPPSLPGSPPTRDSPTCPRYLVSRTGSYGPSLLNTRLKGIPGGKQKEGGPRSEWGHFHGDPVLAPGEKEKEGRVLSRVKTKKYIFSLCLFLTSTNFGLFWAGILGHIMGTS